MFSNFCARKQKASKIKSPGRKLTKVFIKQPIDRKEKQSKSTYIIPR